MLAGVGLGLRRELADLLLEAPAGAIQFLELAPENWMSLGGYWLKKLKQISEKFPLSCHGLSLSLGSPEPLDWEFLGRLKCFLDEFSIDNYSEHLSYTKCDNAHLYELLPIPFRKDAVQHVASRIRDVQDFLGRKIAIENVSYYALPEPQMTEQEFIAEVVKAADCQLLLDVNNVYVNAHNHDYDPKKFIAALPLDRVAFVHMAGHEKLTPELIIDTHGQAIAADVYELFEWTIARIKPAPVLLERDFNFPEWPELLNELKKLSKLCDRNWSRQHAA